jgi:uncharacterized protein YukE
VSGEIAMPAGDPDALERLADQLDRTASGVDSLTSDTVRTTADIKTNADWTGDAADGYTAFTSDLAQGTGATPHPLTQISSAVRSYAGTLRDTQQKVSAYSSAAETANVTRDPADIASAEAIGDDASTALGVLDRAADGFALIVEDATRSLEEAFSPDGLVRKWIETIHAPWDDLGTDGWLSRALGVKQAEQLAESSEEFTKEVPELMGAAKAELYGRLEALGADPLVSNSELMETVVRDTAGIADDSEAIAKYAQGLGKAAEAAGNFGELFDGLSLGSDVLAGIGDAYTLVDPEDGGVMGDVDRTMAGANLVGTGLYLGGDFLYHHWTPFHNFCNDAGHATVASAKDVGHAATSGAKGVWHAITSL